MELSALKEPLNVLIYTESDHSLALKNIENSHTAMIRTQVVQSITDAMCVTDADLIVIESGDYVEVLKDLRLCNRHLANVPVLLFLYLEKRPLDPTLDYVFAHEATPDIMISMMKLIYKTSTDTPHIAPSDVEYPDISKVKVSELEEKYMPQLLKLKEEIASLKKKEGK